MATSFRVVDPCDFPFTRVDQAAIFDPNLSLYDSHVYVALCSFALNKTGGAYPSMRALKDRAKCSERQARASIRVLEAQGYITTKQQSGGVNVYTLTRSKRVEDFEEPEKGETSDTPKETTPASETPAQPAGVPEISGQVKETPAPPAGDPGTVCRRTRLNELGLNHSPTESADPAPTQPHEAVRRPVSLSEIPAAMRQVVKYFLHETGRKGIEPSELPAIRSLERLHYPARINEETDTAVARFRRKGRNPTDLSFGYLLESLQHQNSRKPAKAGKTGKTSKTGTKGRARDAPGEAAGQAGADKDVRQWEREQQEQVLRQFGGD